MSNISYLTNKVDNKYKNYKTLEAEAKSFDYYNLDVKQIASENNISPSRAYLMAKLFVMSTNSPNKVFFDRSEEGPGVLKINNKFFYCPFFNNDITEDIVYKFSDNIDKAPDSFRKICTIMLLEDESKKFGFNISRDERINFFKNLVHTELFDMRKLINSEVYKHVKECHVLTKEEEIKRILKNQKPSAVFYNQDFNEELLANYVKDAFVANAENIVDWLNMNDKESNKYLESQNLGDIEEISIKYDIRDSASFNGYPLGYGHDISFNKVNTFILKCPLTKSDFMLSDFKEFFMFSIKTLIPDVLDERAMVTNDCFTDKEVQKAIDSLAIEETIAIKGSAKIKECLWLWQKYMYCNDKTINLANANITFVNPNTPPSLKEDKPERFYTMDKYLTELKKIMEGKSELPELEKTIFCQEYIDKANNILDGILIRHFQKMYNKSEKTVSESDFIKGQFQKIKTEALSRNCKRFKINKKNILIGNELKISKDNAEDCKTIECCKTKIENSYKSPLRPSFAYVKKLYTDSKVLSFLNVSSDGVSNTIEVTPETLDNKAKQQFHRCAINYNKKTDKFKISFHNINGKPSSPTYDTKESAIFPSEITSEAEKKIFEESIFNILETFNEQNDRHITINFSKMWEKFEGQSKTYSPFDPAHPYKSQSLDEKIANCSDINKLLNKDEYNYIKSTTKFFDASSFLL